MSARLMILDAGPLCTLQDSGRHGFLRYGITPAGPMDWIGYATACRLAGNPESGAAIEIGPGGITLAAEGGALRLGLSTSGFRVLRDGSRLPSRAAITLAEGATLSVAPGQSGLWAYAALAGGMAVQPVMGSLSTHLRSGIGPLPARALASGDTIRPASASGTADPEYCLVGDAAEGDRPIRFVPGPQDERFAPEVMARFLSADYSVARQSDRMAYRLSGPSLPATGGHDIVSDGIALGAIQVPGDGQPFVLMADRQPTGGYPKIGTVIRADLPRLAQTRPGQNVRFQAVTVAEAVLALREARARVTDFGENVRLLAYVRPGGPN